MVQSSDNVRKPVRVNGRVIGWLENGVFCKLVAGTKRQLRKTPAWSIDAEAFDKEIKPCATELVITDKKTGTNYRVSVKKFERLKQELDRGYGKQYYLLPSYWEVEVNGISVVQEVCDF